MWSFTYEIRVDSATGDILPFAGSGQQTHPNDHAAKGDCYQQKCRRSQGLAGGSVVRSAWVVQQTQIGKYHTRSGHGFSAEDANALSDRWSGLRVEQVGTSNTLNGPDRISAGVAIQSKYCGSAKASFKGAFGADGKFRYTGQVLEVPPEQYVEVVDRMAQAIREGRVDGVTEPSRAAELVRPGTVSYLQSRRISQAGNVDSVWFDAKLGTPNAVLSAGIAFCGDLYGSWNDVPKLRARALDSAKAGAAAGAQTLFTSVVTSQMLRTVGARKMTVVVRVGLKAASKTSLGRDAIGAVASVSLGRAVRGAAAVNHCSKLMRSSVIGGTVSLATTTVPNVGRAMVGKMTWGQVGRRGAEDAASTFAGMAGWTTCFTLGTMACATFMTGGAVVVGATIIGIAGSAAAGTGASYATRAAVDAVVGKEVAPTLAADVPKWLGELFLAHKASAKERTRILVENSSALQQWKRFDDSMRDSEARAQAEFHVLAMLQEARSSHQRTGRNTASQHARVKRRASLLRQRVCAHALTTCRVHTGFHGHPSIGWPV